MRGSQQDGFMNVQAIQEIYRQFETLGFADMGEQLSRIAKDPSQIGEETAFTALSCWSEGQRIFLEAALEDERDWVSLVSQVESLQQPLKDE